MLNNSLKKGYSLIEITIALLILTVAVIPLIGTISNDTNNAVVISNSEYAMQKARFILDTLLDSVDFDELDIGDPAELTGKSKDDYLESMFPEENNEKCRGYFSDGKEQRFYAYLRVVNIKDINFKCYENPNLSSMFYNIPPSGGKTLAELASETEYLQNIPSSIGAHSIYNRSDWAKEEQSYSYDDFFQESNTKPLLKALFLTIRWNDKNKQEPESEGYKEFNFFFISLEGFILIEGLVD